MASHNTLYALQALAEKGMLPDWKPEAAIRLTIRNSENKLPLAVKWELYPLSLYSTILPGTKFLVSVFLAWIP